MQATCPKNKKHKKFFTTAHVVQDWLVDENGNFIEADCDCLEVTHGPDIDNTWVCASCGAEAIIIEEGE